MAFNKMKIFALFAVLLALLFAVGVFAEAGDEIFTERVPEPDMLEASSSYRVISSATADALLEYVYSQVKVASLQIDILKFKVPYTNNGANDVWDVWSLMTHTYCDVEYYAQPIYPSVERDSTGNYIQYLNISTYKAWNSGSGSSPISQSEILETNAKIDAKINGIISQLSPEMSDLEKVVFVHDWLCVYGEYDLRLYDGTMPRSSYDIRGILLYGVGVCQSYTWAFDDIMDELGIDCINVTSDSMNHTWNQVKIGGYWYNMDITWDDPTSNAVGRARHEYFLCSDADFTNNREHYGYYDGVACSSTKYDSAFWKDVDTPMPYIDGETFYLRQTEGVIKAMNIDTLSSIRSVRSVSDGWPYYYTYDYTCSYFSSLAEYGGKIFFNLADSIVSMNPDGSEYTVLKSFSTSDSSHVYGLYINGDYLYYGYGAKPSVAVTPAGSFSVFVPITSIKLPYANAKLEYGYYAIIDAVVNSGADASRLIWSSSDPTVAPVSAGGRVDALKYGTTVITATSPDNSSVKAVMNLTIYAKTTSISLAGNPANVIIGKTAALKIQLNTGALLNDIVWSSSNSNVLSVDASGIVTAKAYGTATITAKSYENPSVYASVTITVGDALPGDPTGDGVINATDAVVIAQYLAGWSTAYDMSIADVNRDGAVNAIDAVAVAQYIAGWNVVLG